MPKWWSAVDILKEHHQLSWFSGLRHFDKVFINQKRQYKTYTKAFKTEAEASAFTYGMSVRLS